MPYSSTAELPAAAKKYSEKCQRAFLHAFNSSMADHGNESRAFATGHAAAKQCQEAQKAMPNSNVATKEATTPRQAKFRVFSGALTPFDGGVDDGRKRLRTIASSTVEDLGGDVITPKALQMMAESAKGRTIFRNHSYKVPDDILGAVEKAEIKHAGTDGQGKPIYDLMLDVLVRNDAKSMETFEAIESGVQLGTSIGAMIPPGGARLGENGGYIFDALKFQEASIVGIPQNPRSWVQYATKAFKAAEAVEDDEEEPNTGFLSGNEDEPVEKEAEVETTEAVTDVATEKDAEPDVDKDAEPELTTDAVEQNETDTSEADTDEQKDTEPDLTASAAPDITASIEVSTEETEETPAQELAKSVPDSAEEVAEDTLTKSAEMLADLVKSLSRETVTLRTDLTKAIEERDQARAAVKDAQANADFAIGLVTQLANTPFGRKAVAGDTNLANDMSRFSGIYSAEVLKMLEKKT